MISHKVPHLTRRLQCFMPTILEHWCSACSVLYGKGGMRQQATLVVA